MITIDDPETERLVRDLAARSGRSVEAVVQDAVRERAAQMTSSADEVPPEEQARRHAILVEFARRFDTLPVLDNRSADEIIGYDENGLPT